jgi:hypothetical protein
VRVLKLATAKTVRASAPYPAVLEPGIEEIGWLFGAFESARAHGRTRQRRSHRHAGTRAQGFDFSFSTFGKTMPFFGNILPALRSYSGIE